MFEIPCLATHGECVGRRVERYRLGLTIPEATPDHALAVLPLLASRTDRNGDALHPCFGEYRDDHSLVRLDGILTDLLASV